MNIFFYWFILYKEHFLSNGYPRGEFCQEPTEGFFLKKPEMKHFSFSSKVLNVLYSFSFLGYTLVPRGIGIRGSGDPFFLSPDPLNLLHPHRSCGEQWAVEVCSANSFVLILLTTCITPIHLSSLRELKRPKDLYLQH